MFACTCLYMYEYVYIACHALGHNLLVRGARLFSYLPP